LLAASVAQKGTEPIFQLRRPRVIAKPSATEIGQMETFNGMA
jgi:hypothetical protein